MLSFHSSLISVTATVERLRGSLRTAPPTSLVQPTFPQTFRLLSIWKCPSCHRPPRALYFSCMKAPTSSGGETALCDFTKVYQELSPELRQKFLDKKVMYTRTHKKIPNANSLFNFDVADMKGWPELFGTDDKKEVERICKEEGVNVQWKGDTFVSVIKSEAFQCHPITQVRSLCEASWKLHSRLGMILTTFIVYSLFIMHRNLYGLIILRYSTGQRFRWKCFSPSFEPST